MRAVRRNFTKSSLEMESISLTRTTPGPLKAMPAVGSLTIGIFWLPKNDFVLQRKSLNFSMRAERNKTLHQIIFGNGSHFVYKDEAGSFKSTFLTYFALTYNFYY